jgi:hypothetical protein
LYGDEQTCFVDRYSRQAIPTGEFAGDIVFPKRKLQTRHRWFELSEIVFEWYKVNNHVEALLCAWEDNQLYDMERTVVWSGRLLITWEQLTLNDGRGYLLSAFW